MQINGTRRVYKTKDDYGRSVTVLDIGGGEVARLVTLPRAYRERYGHTHLVRDHFEGVTHYCASRSEAVTVLNGIG